jgi:hypothetical protein
MPLVSDGKSKRGGRGAVARIKGTARARATDQWSRRSQHNSHSGITSSAWQSLISSVG